MTTRIVGIGQAFAGDDGLGFAVAARVRELGPGDGVQVLDLADAMDLVPLLEQTGRVVVIDAAVGGEEPGRLHVMAPEAFASGGIQPVSTHGISVGGAIALARSLYENAAATEVYVLAIEIDYPAGYATELSPAVARAVDSAARVAMALARGELP